MLNELYAAVARRRRERYARRPDLRRRLRRPVISVGNLAVGGRGKTPVVAALARVLIAAGERPAILSRGYGRTQPDDGVVVVNAPDGIRADLARAGDEPLMLARQLPGVPILVAGDRYLAGWVAEQHFAVTVHVLDDGFQHLPLERDLDLVIVAAEDLAPSARTLPFGRLREAPDALVAADAILTADPAVHMPEDDVRPLFRLRRGLGALRGGDGEAVACEQPMLAVSGIANPSRFVSDLRDAGVNAVRSLAFRDHHPYREADLTRIVTAARDCGAKVVVTTEKDFVRLLPFRPFPLPVVYLPLTMDVEPAAEFGAWLEASLRAARDITVD